MAIEKSRLTIEAGRFSLPPGRFVQIRAIILLHEHHTSFIYPSVPGGVKFLRSENIMANSILFPAQDDHASQIRYASQQLALYRSALVHWQTCVVNLNDTFHESRVQYEVAYYTQQVERWQDYLAALRR